MNTDAIHIVSTGLVGSYLYSGREYPDAKVFLLYSFHCLFHVYGGTVYVVVIGRLVPVSSTPHGASTPGLSTP